MQMSKDSFKQQVYLSPGKSMRVNSLHTYLLTVYILVTQITNSTIELIQYIFSRKHTCSRLLSQINNYYPLNHLRVLDILFAVLLY